MSFSHIDKKGNAKFVDISEKPHTQREAEATATISMNKEAFTMLGAEETKKGNVLAVAQLAGMMAAKKTHDLIPLCHPIGINSIDINFKKTSKSCTLQIFSKVKAFYKTGVEMEALTAATVSALTVYDMIKSVDKSAHIERIYLVSKNGGKSGEYKV